MRGKGLDGKVRSTLFSLSKEAREGKGRIRALLRPNSSLFEPILPFLLSRARRNIHFLRFSDNAVELPCEEGDASRPHESSAFSFFGLVCFFFFSDEQQFLFLASRPSFSLSLSLSLSFLFLSFFFLFSPASSFNAPTPLNKQTATPRPTSASTTASTLRPSPR